MRLHILHLVAYNDLSSRLINLVFTASTTNTAKIYHATFCWLITVSLVMHLQWVFRTVDGKKKILCKFGWSVHRF